MNRFITSTKGVFGESKGKIVTAPKPAWLCCLLTASAFAQSPSDAEFFEERVRPVLATQCFACHTDSKLGGLRLDSREALLSGGKSGPAIVPGQPEASLLIRAINHENPNLKMPMGGRLDDSQIDDLTTWVRIGAPWPEAPEAVAQAPRKEEGFTITPEERSFWSFQPIQKPRIPKVKQSGWPRSPIDHFVLDGLEAKNLEPVRAADKRTLIRRAYFDLIGLPPAPEEVDAFVADSSPGAFSEVVDRLLASPRYGERWARHWLDVARYADGEGGERRRRNDPYANSWRYRDWVIAALNRDMPYDLFVKAQIAGDLLDPDDRERLVPGLGLFGLGPWGAGTQVSFHEDRAAERDDRVDVVSRGILGLTVACARCHDHKYDPISQKDYYALVSVFASTEYKEYLLSSQEDMERYKAHQEKVRAANSQIQRFLRDQEKTLREILAQQTSRYLMAAWPILSRKVADTEVEKIAFEHKLDQETLGRWLEYLREPQRNHPFLDDWDALIARDGGTEEEARKIAGEFQALVLTVLKEKNEIDEQNAVASKNYKPRDDAERAVLPGGNIVYDDFCEDCKLVFKPIERDKYIVWLDLFVANTGLSDFVKREKAVLQYNGDALLRFLGPEWKRHVELLREERKALEDASPPEYAYLMGITDKEKPNDVRLNVRGSVVNLGDEVPRGFPAILAGTGGEPSPFHSGSGRLELAEAIVNHPLAARVIVNRIWMHHFGRGIVSTPSNFGRLGERPSHPELLEYLAGRLRENGWSLKALHREIMLSATYQLSSDASEAAMAVDPDNILHWRMNWRRLDAELIRDSLLHVSGSLNGALGGPASEMSAENDRRAVYGRVSRSRPNELLTLFDFPDPRLTSEQRVVTNVPLQGLFFLNSELVRSQAEKFAKRLQNEAGGEDAPKIVRAYRLLYGREPLEFEIQAGLKFLQEARSESDSATAPDESWASYTQVLLGSNEFLYVN